MTTPLEFADALRRGEPHHPFGATGAVEVGDVSVLDAYARMYEARADESTRPWLGVLFALMGGFPLWGILPMWWRGITGKHCCSTP